jgi:hypothetical protein
MKNLIRKYIILIVVLIGAANFAVSQNEYRALQRSSIVKSTPYEAQGYVLFHQTSGVEQWSVIATKGDPGVVIPENFISRPGFDYLWLPKVIWSNSAYTYKIQGLNAEGKVVLEEDHTPPADPDNNQTHYLNGCNRPTCNAETYAYSILVYSHLDENLTNYYLKLGNAWTGYNEAGIEIPYYQRIQFQHLSTIIVERGLQHNGFDYYQDPDDGGYYFVKKDRGQWKNVSAITGELTSGEECFLTYYGAEQALNAYGTFSSNDGTTTAPLLNCQGQAISSNETTGGGDVITPAVSAYGGFIDCIWDLSFGDSDYTLQDLWDCWGNTANPGNGGPCPEGYYYSPGGGNPCVEIEDIIVHPLDVYGEEPAEPITFALKDKIVRKKPNRSAINNHVFPSGLYNIGVKLSNGVYIPILKSYDKEFMLLSVPEDRTLNQQDFSVYPNPINSGVAFTIESEVENDYPYTYSVVDSKTGNVLTSGSLSHGTPVQCTINNNSNKPVHAIIHFSSNDPGIDGDATKHLIIRP